MAKQDGKMGCLAQIGLLWLILFLLGLVVTVAGCIGFMNNPHYSSVTDGMSALMQSGSQSAASSSDDGAADSSQQESSGTVLYDGDDMKIAFLRIEETPGLEAATLYFEVENKTADQVMAGPELGSVDVNGYNITSLGGAISINPGNKAMAPIILGYKQFDATSIEGVKSVSMNMQLINDSLDVVAEAPISMTF